MPGERFTFPACGLELSAELALPQGASRASALLLAHGAGYHMGSDWMTRVAEGLAARGFAVLRFNYPYRQRAPHAHGALPDRAGVLEEAHCAARAALAERAGARRILLGGKSLGARIATLVAAKGEPCAGLVLFGYPLHPPRQPARTRSEHFPALAQPALFLQGTRDEFAELELLRAALARYGGRATLELVEDADHGFHVPKRTGRTDAEVLDALLDRVARWDAETFPT